MRRVRWMGELSFFFFSVLVHQIRHFTTFTHPGKINPLLCNTFVRLHWCQGDTWYHSLQLQAPVQGHWSSLGLTALHSGCKQKFEQRWIFKSLHTLWEIRVPKGFLLKGWGSSLNHLLLKNPFFGERVHHGLFVRLRVTLRTPFTQRTLFGRKTSSMIA